MAKSKPRSEEDERLESFIQDWHWDKPSHKVAQQAGAFLFAFLNSLEQRGLSRNSLSSYRTQIWCIGILECQYGGHNRFSPSMFIRGPRWEYEYKRKQSDSANALEAYRRAWRKLDSFTREYLRRQAQAQPGESRGGNASLAGIES